MTNKTPRQLINQLAVEQIAEHGGFVATSAIRRLGCELDFSQAEIAAIVDLITDKCPLIASIKMAPQLHELMKCDPRVKFLMDMAFRIEERCRAKNGKTRSYAER